MINVGTGVVEILPDVRKFGPALQAGMASPLAGLTKASSLAAAAVGAGLVVGLNKAVDTTLHLADETRKLQRELGLTAEDASKLRVAGEELGISTDDLSRGFGLFSKNLVNAAPNLEKYGINIVRASDGQVDFLATLGNVSDAFNALPKGVDQTAFAMNVFGRSGKTLIPILQQGSAGLADLYDEASRLGLVMSQEDVQAARELAIAQRELTGAWQGLEVQLGNAVIPVLKALTDVMTEVVIVIQHIPGPVKTAALAITALAVAIKAAQVISGFFAGTIGALIPAQVAQTAVTTAEAEAFTLYIANASGAVVATETFAAAEATAGAAGIGLLGVLGPLGLIVGGFAGFMALVAIRTGEANRAIAESKAILADHTSTTLEAGKAARVLAVEQDGYSGRLPHTTEQIAAQKKEIDALRGAQDDATSSTIDATGAVQENTDALFTHNQLLAENAQKFHLVGDAASRFLGKTAAEWRSWEHDSRDALTGVTGALQDLAGQSSVTAKGILKSFSQQVDAQKNYRRNWDELLARGAPKSLLDQLQTMGLEGKKVLNALANANDEQFTKIIGKWVQSQGIAKDTSDDIAGIGRTVKVLPSGKVITILAHTSQAQEAILQLERQLAGLRSQSGSLGLNFGTAATGFHGVVTQPTLMLMGEAGQERVDITPGSVGGNGGAAIAGHGSGHTFIFNGDVYGMDDFERKVGSAVASVFAGAAR